MCEKVWLNNYFKTFDLIDLLLVGYTAFDYFFLFQFINGQKYFTKEDILFYFPYFNSDFC